MNFIALKENSLLHCSVRPLWIKTGYQQQKLQKAHKLMETDQLPTVWKMGQDKN